MLRYIVENYFFLWYYRYFQDIETGYNLKLNINEEAYPSYISYCCSFVM